jgi:hypothetical protein
LFHHPRNKDIQQRKAGRIFSQPFYGGLHCGLRSPCGVCPPVAGLSASHRAYRWRTPALRVSNPTSGTSDSHHAAGGVHKAQEHIHRDSTREFYALVLVCLFVRSSTYFCRFFLPFPTISRIMPLAVAKQAWPKTQKKTEISMVSTDLGDYGWRAGHV